MNDYSTNIRLNPSENNRSQFVYASQTYGTFFAIFAKFTTREVLDNHNKILNGQVILEQIDFELINYKGLLDLSLEQVDMKIDEILNITDKSPQEVNISVSLKGAVLEEPIRLKSIKDINQTVLNDADFYVKREVLSLNGETRDEFDKNSQAKSYVGGVFDEEFFYRNGKLEPQRRRDGDFALNNMVKANQAKLNYSNSQAHLHLGTWCIGTKSKITTN